MIPGNGSASMNWDDVRVFLAVARHGSLRAAGRALGLSQPTIGRRLASFEATFGGPTLFIRGGKSNYIADTDEPAIRQRFPQATVQTITTANHWVHADAPEEFVRLVSDFL